MGRRALGHRDTHGNCADGADVPPRTAKDAILAAHPAWGGDGGSALVSGDGDVWVVCEGLCHIHGGLRIAECGHCAVGVAVYRFSDCVARSRTERASLSQDGGERRHGKEGERVTAGTKALETG